MISIASFNHCSVPSYFLCPSKTHLFYSLIPGQMMRSFAQLIHKNSLGNEKEHPHAVFFSQKVFQYRTQWNILDILIVCKFSQRTKGELGLVWKALLSHDCRRVDVVFLSNQVTFSKQSCERVRHRNHVERETKVSSSLLPFYSNMLNNSRPFQFLATNGSPVSEWDESICKANMSIFHHSEKI